MGKLLKIMIWCAAAIVGVSVGFVAFHNNTMRGGSSATTAAARTAPAPVPVMTVTAGTKNTPVIIRGLGAVTAYNTVDVKSRVEGNVVNVNFKEGQEVKPGDLLIQLDVRPFQAALDQAQASLAKDQANLVNAQKDLVRYSDLLKRSFAPEQQVATQKATVAADEAIIAGDKAMIDATKLNVEYASIRSPIDGITGIRQIDLGNLVQANSGTLVVVTQIKPIYVVFTIPETDIPRVRSAMSKGKLTVLAYDPADQKQIAQGTLELVDNQVDQASGTVKLKARFPNKDEALWPGQFVNAHLVVETVENGITVSSAAVQTGPKGTFVYVVKPDDTVEVRPVTVTQTEDNVSLIGSGLTEGEQVVTVGQSRLTPGAAVAIANNNTGIASATPAEPGGVATQ
ncbi:efflux RND transporter periplasmic adaptor subunit [Pseudaminobacter soli (ex Li et al. 2025)]|nr:efflux RND transporter periplasmic adaptor subunit [Mesorhizobium soli]